MNASNTHLSTASLTMGDLGDFCQQEGATARSVREVPNRALRERGFVARMRTVGRAVAAAGACAAFAAMWSREGNLKAKE